MDIISIIIILIIIGTTLYIINSIRKQKEEILLQMYKNEIMTYRAIYTNLKDKEKEELIRIIKRHNRKDLIEQIINKPMMRR